MLKSNYDMAQFIPLIHYEAEFRMRDSELRNREPRIVENHDCTVPRDATPSIFPLANWPHETFVALTVSFDSCETTFSLSSPNASP